MFRTGSRWISLGTVIFCRIIITIYEIEDYKDSKDTDRLNRLLYAQVEGNFADNCKNFVKIFKRFF